MGPEHPVAFPSVVPASQASIHCQGGSREGGKWEEGESWEVIHGLASRTDRGDMEGT